MNIVIENSKSKGLVGVPCILRMFSADQHGHLLQLLGLDQRPGSSESNAHEAKICIGFHGVLVCSRNVARSRSAQKQPLDATGRIKHDFADACLLPLSPFTT